MIKGFLGGTFLGEAGTLNKSHNMLYTVFTVVGEQSSNWSSSVRYVFQSHCNVF